MGKTVLGMKDMEGVGQHREWVGAWSAPRSKNEGVLCLGQGCNTWPVRNRMMWWVRLGTPELGRRCSATYLQEWARMYRISTFYHTSSMVYWMKSSWMGVAWMYGVIITTCFLKYSWKESPAQRPLAFMTLNSTPQRRYSRVNLILMPCPCNGLRPTVHAASPTLSKNFAFVSRRQVFVALYAKRCEISKGWLTWRCCTKATVGSVSPSWEAQYTSSLSLPDALVLGRCSTITLNPLWSWL